MALSVVPTSNNKTRANSLISRLSLREKIGQLVQVNGHGGHVPEELRHAVVSGGIGSVINEVDPATISELQRIAREDTEHGIPLLIGRDVIHGFKTVMPIPLGLAATWNEALIEQGAAVAASEAVSQGINWTFSPMIDVSRDPRWGRIAESFGEDPLLTGLFGAAMVRGYDQNPDARMASCLKHFVGYGASEAGRDYNTTNVPEVELRNVYLPPFEMGVAAGAQTIMPSFSDLNGMPPSGSQWLMRKVLRHEWGFTGFVISDWASITQLAVHGVAENDKDSADKAIKAGVNMDMASGAYARYLIELIEEGIVSEEMLDELVLEVLNIKFQLGLFDASDRVYCPAQVSDEANETAYQSAVESVIMLKNGSHQLPLNDSGDLRIGLIGPLADQPYEQLGTWIFDGDVEVSVSLRTALEERLGDRLSFAPGLETSRDMSTGLFDEAVRVAEHADVVVLALGEEAILSGEAHCRSDITLPGAQEALLETLAELGKPVIVVIMAGRPLVLENVVPKADAILFAFHPGCMGGPALRDLLFGDAVPMGKLPVTFPRNVGQIPVYYGHRLTGKPATPETIVSIHDIDPRAPQLSVGNTSFHLDVHPSPAFPFGYGLSYTQFEYANFRIEERLSTNDGRLKVAVDVRNAGAVTGTETVQLYIHDRVASITRPVRELKAFDRIGLAPDQTATIRFELKADAFAFHNGESRVVEPGMVDLWVGGDSTADLWLETSILDGHST